MKREGWRERRGEKRRGEEKKGEERKGKEIRGEESLHDGPPPVWI